MLEFARNKLVSVVFSPPNLLKAHGVLDDTIYGLELDMTIDLDNFTIEDISGRWNRHTTPDCPRALDALQAVRGLSAFDEGFAARVNKVVGRKGCRHFANLLLECCDSARRAALVIGRETGGPDSANKSTDEAPSASSVQVAEGVRPAPKRAAAESVRGKFCLETHLHSFPASSCSSASIDSLIAEAKRIGLHGICVTDHNHVWQSDAIERLRRTHDFIILRGNEITTDQGDVLVFGMNKDITGIVSCADLRKEVDRAGGYMIAAHPFRGFLTFNAQQIGLTPEKAAQRQLFRCVDAIEVLNSKVTAEESDFARQVARILGLPITGGSDAHAVDEVGIYATVFDERIETEIELVEALKSGRFSPAVFRASLRKNL